MYIRPSRKPATPEELAEYTAERKIRHAVAKKLPWGAEHRIGDPALRVRVRATPVYRCPVCPECKRTIRHYGRCSMRKTFKLKPTKEWALTGEPDDDKA